MFYDEILFLNNTSIHIRFISNFALEKIADLLQQKGMRPEIALLRAKEVFAGESSKAGLYLQNIQHYFGKELMCNIYDFVANKALFQEPIRFDSYDHVLRIMQEVHSFSLNEEELNQIRYIAQANHYQIALAR